MRDPVFLFYGNIGYKLFYLVLSGLGELGVVVVQAIRTRIICLLSYSVTLISGSPSAVDSSCREKQTCARDRIFFATYFIRDKNSISVRAEMPLISSFCTL